MMLRKWLRVTGRLLATLVIGALVAATLYFTYFDPRWITFLGGVLFAAVLALFSQVSRAEWRVLRRTKQIARLQQRLTEELALRRNLERALKDAEERLQAAQTAAAAAPAPAPAPTPSPNALYVEAMLEGNGWEDPKTRLEQALRGDGFLLFQQRIEPVAGGEPMCEILLRLREEEENLLPPGGFFPAAERYGMMEALDRWVVAELTRRIKPSPGAPVYCVNVSSAALAGEGFPLFVREQIATRGFDGSRLCFEIPEADLVARPIEAQRMMAVLRPAGCRFTVDAFGSVKGSFAGLRGLRVDFIKIDGIIVQNLLRNPVEVARARAIVSVCRKLGVRTIAEFVEDNVTRAKLAEIGVDYVQGFGVARPEPLKIMVAIETPQVVRAA